MFQIGGYFRPSRNLRSQGFPVTVAAAIAVVAPAGREESIGATLMLMRDPTAARPVLLQLLLQLLLLLRHATVARPVLLRLLLPRHATVARPVLLQLLLLPRHATAAHTPPVPKTTADDKSMKVRGFRRRTHRRPLFHNFMGLALRVDGTDGVL